MIQNTDSGDRDSGDTDSGDTDSGDRDSGDTDSGDTDSGDTDSIAVIQIAVIPLCIRCTLCRGSWAPLSASSQSQPCTYCTHSEKAYIITIRLIFAVCMKEF